MEQGIVLRQGKLQRVPLNTQSILEGEKSYTVWCHTSPDLVLIKKNHILKKKILLFMKLKVIV